MRTNVKRVKRIEPYTPQWESLANSLARNWVPTIYPCHDCGGPVIKGYVCERCGSVNPEGAK